ncbi:DUF7573 domain-containing protein [Natronobiforma cellulositropha]|uniref:DUF7573 domain-containing protein n=1 Tax=Natronobiforma cellulositropha TaxID=1679076 RepID=UPI0021D578E3|nr:hypothetical protein [Natronobiforma cellulositropha]
MSDEATLRDFLETVDEAGASSEAGEEGGDSSDESVSEEGDGSVGEEGGDSSDGSVSEEGDGSVSEETTVGEAVAGEGVADGEVEPALATYAWGPYECDRCGERVSRVWRGDEAPFVCESCKRW